MEREKLRLKLKKVNPSCVLADNLFGKEHTIKHKMVAGVILMVIGVTISKLHFESLPYFHYFADGIGYFLHGMGGIPFGEYLATTAGVVVGVEQEIERQQTENRIINTQNSRKYEL